MSNEFGANKNDAIMSVIPSVLTMALNVNGHNLDKLIPVGSNDIPFLLLLVLCMRFYFYEITSFHILTNQLMYLDFRAFVFAYLHSMAKFFDSIM